VVLASQEEPNALTSFNRLAESDTMSARWNSLDPITGDVQKMKRFAILLTLAFSLACFIPGAAAQLTTDDHKNDYNHGALGGFFNFTHQQGSGFNLLGAGGRIGFKIQRRVFLEAEMAYDFEKTQTQTITVGSATTTTRSSLRLLHAVGGPKILIIKDGPIRVFALAKGGILNFGLGGPATAGAIGTQLGTISDGDTKGVMYPGAGIETGSRWLSFRAEIGDEIYFSHGTQHNIRATFGPQFRF
jgi:hypothetical protein